MGDIDFQKILWNVGSIKMQLDKKIREATK